MSSTILSRTRRLRPVVLTAAFLSAAPCAVQAHEVPARATVTAFARREGGSLRLVLRAPLESMRDVQWPTRGAGYLDLVNALPFARDAAEQWIAGFLEAYQDGERLPDARIVGIRISLPSDRSFTSYERAIGSVLGPPVDPRTEIPWSQAALDVVLDFPVSPDEASTFAILPRLGHLGLRTTTVLRYITTSGATRAYQYVGDPGLIRLDPRWHHAAWQFTKLGISHILGGIDHLLFVLCLVVPFRRMRPLIVIVTAFTVAHSITLISAALGIVPDALWFPPLIETLIAASIVYMALENIVGARWQRRWLIAFGFGLIHGFGFSFALGESLQFAGAHLAVSLLAFNAGVEIGQILVLAMAVPLVTLLFRYVVAERMAIIILSAFVAHTAWHWMIDRAAALGEYELMLPQFNLALAASAMRAAMVLVIAAGAAWLMSELYRRLGANPARLTESSEQSTANT